MPPDKDGGGGPEGFYFTRRTKDEDLEVRVGYHTIRLILRYIASVVTLAIAVLAGHHTVNWADVTTLLRALV